MKSFSEWHENREMSEVSKPIAATAGWFLGGPIGAMVGHHLGQDEKPSSSNKSKPKPSGSLHPNYQDMVDLSPEELLKKGVVEGEIIRDIFDRTGARSIETRWNNGVRSTKFIGHVDRVHQNMVGLSTEELVKQGIIKGEVIKDETNEEKERWITTKSRSGIETIKYIGQTNW